MKEKRLAKKAISPQFRVLRWQLLWSYLIIMVAIRLISNSAMYQFFTRSLYQQMDNRLVNLAQAAAHSLMAIKQDSTAVNQTDYYQPDGDEDLDIAWQNLRKPEQSVEWFGAKKQLLASSGTLALNLPPRLGFQTIRSEKIRALTIPSYSYRNQERKLEGYIRVSESIQDLDYILIQLRWGAVIGGVIAFGLIGVGGMWLTGQSLKPIEQSFQQLKQFTADASHELRSPLTAIKTSVEVMQTHRHRLASEDAQMLKAIASASKQMTRLVEDLLLLARTEGTAVKLTQNWRSIPLDELLEDVVEFLEPKAEAKQITLQSKLATRVSVKGDDSQLIRLFSNLVENALQYTPAGGKVNVTLQQVEELAVIRVLDTGIGIAPEHLPLVFNRLWRADKARVYCQEGSGLGLAIAQAIARRHGGEITVRSELRVGSCFTICLPVVL